MLALFLVLVIVFTYAKTVAYGNMHNRWINKMAVHSDLDAEAAEILMIYMALICITAAGMITLGGVGLLPNIY